MVPGMNRLEERGMSCSDGTAPVMRKSMGRSARDGNVDDAWDGKKFDAGYGEASLRQRLRFSR